MSNQAFTLSTSFAKPRTRRIPFGASSLLSICLSLGIAVSLAAPSPSAAEVPSPYSIAPDTVAPAPAPTCIANACSVVFPFNGASYRWVPPYGASGVSFELFGAQGGKSGGLGGKVVGTFKQVPEALYLVIGGAGIKGAQAAGGYNGGAAAGGPAGDEGSGGGASDIRIGLGLSDRIAVAGGGGGSGGWVGGKGGAGGGLLAAKGANGQGTGGLGGTQDAGGSGGVSNGVALAPGADGGFGFGGQGAVAGRVGGGGGGGGYFGGGGGGADTDTCCSDGGGGGGGSSHTSQDWIENVTHTAGQKSSSGSAVLRYFLPIAVIEFAPNRILSSDGSASYSLRFNFPVSGLAVEDFVLPVDSECALTLTPVPGVGETFAQSSSYLIELTGCRDQILEPALSAHSVEAGISGPSTAFSGGTVRFDSAAPSASFAALAVASGSFVPSFDLSFDEPVAGLGPEDLSVTGVSGCLISVLPLDSARFQVLLSGCQLGTLRIELAEQSVLDLAGNSGPVATVLSEEFTLVEAPRLKKPSAKGGGDPVAAEPKEWTKPLGFGRMR